MSRRLTCGLCLTMLRMQAQAAQAPHETVEVRAYVDDKCIIADEPFFLPVAGNGSDQATAKFLPLIGLIVGKLAELYINHQLQSSADRIKAGAARKDTRYAVTKQMNLYRAEFQPAPTLRINANLGCMTIVAASFKPEPADCTAQYAPKELSPETRDLPQSEWKTSRTDDSIENQLRRANVCLNGNAKAVYEARFEFSADGTAYRLKDAGYRIESLLTTPDKGAARTTLYTLKISNPGATDQQEVLSSAWVNIGTVSAGAHASGARANGAGANGAGANGAKGDAAPWLRVPPMSVEARRIYEEKTKTHQEVMGEIEALKRAQTRNQRILDSMDQRIATADAATAEGLKQERTRIAVQNQTQGAELDARNAEYRDLPRTPMEFMPVTIEVAVTETESEKKAQLAMAEIIGKNSDVVGSAIGTSATTLLSRSLPGPADSAGELERARAGYFDALIEVQSSAAGGAGADSQRNLALMKDRYNEARRSQGLEQIK
jgi:hypothetical protein